jgi:hypothetical protein
MRRITKTIEIAPAEIAPAEIAPTEIDPAPTRLGTRLCNNRQAATGTLLLASKN